MGTRLWDDFSLVDDIGLDAITERLGQAKGAKYPRCAAVVAKLDVVL